MIDAEVKESRKEVLSKAWDAVEEKNDGDPGAVDKTASGLTKDDSGGEEKPAKSVEKTDEESGKGSEPEKAKEEETPDQKEAKAAAELERRPASAPVTDKAPIAWRAGAKAKWATVDPEIRAEISRRELEVQQTLTQTGQVRRFAEDFAKTIQPYSHLIRAQNSTPLQAVSNLMQTAAGLMQGTQEQKAKIVSEIIANYGVDIQTLDRVLSSGPAPSQPVHQPVPEWAKPMFAFMGNVQKMQEQREYQMQQEAEQEIARCSEKPFFEELREDMADLMEAAANRGRKMTMDQAYEKALALNPEYAKIVNQRSLAAQARNPVSEAAATLARARKAASTVKGAPQGPNAGATNGKLSRKDQLRAAWDESSS